MKESMYLDLLKKTLIDYHRMDLGTYVPFRKEGTSLKYNMLVYLNNLLQKKGYEICTYQIANPKDRDEGKDWPVYADSMIGLKRLNNIQYCFTEVIKNNIPGDFIETGVWRGGATIFMKAMLKNANIDDRNVWVADSFEGLPKPDEEKYPADKGDNFHTRTQLAISMDQVKNNFKKYDLLDDKVRFLKGWFKDTLPTAPIEKLAILRLDGDMYESTMDALKNLYSKLSVGGFIIVDDWGAVPSCKQAVLDYRKQHNITEEIQEIDWSGVYWRKEK